MRAGGCSTVLIPMIERKLRCIYTHPSNPTCWVWLSGSSKRMYSAFPLNLSNSNRVWQAKVTALSIHSSQPCRVLINLPRWVRLGCKADGLCKPGQAVVLTITTGLPCLFRASALQITSDHVFSYRKLLGHYGERGSLNRRSLHFGAYVCEEEWSLSINTSRLG
jgi:hypothetical protein